MPVVSIITRPQFVSFLTSGILSPHKYKLGLVGGEGSLSIDIRRRCECGQVLQLCEGGRAQIINKLHVDVECVFQNHHIEVIQMVEVLLPVECH